LRARAVEGLSLRITDIDCHRPARADGSAVARPACGAGRTGDPKKYG
jgi:hypothetical protein